jgi:hypothetical protein
MIPARNVIDAHAQHFLVNEELLLPIPEALEQCTRSPHTIRNTICFQCACTIRGFYRAYQQYPNILPQSQLCPAPRQTCFSSVGIISLSVVRSPVDNYQLAGKNIHTSNIKGTSVLRHRRWRHHGATSSKVVKLIFTTVMTSDLSCRRRSFQHINP